jgi:hypothetical protein
MAIMESEIENRRWPVWVLVVGLLGLANFMIGFWSLLPPAQRHRIYFWPIVIYSRMFFPVSFIILPISITIIVLWVSRIIKKGSARIIFGIIGLLIGSGCCLYGSLVSLFVATLQYDGQVEQNNRVYYLLNYYDDDSLEYLFCKADGIGFSGDCRLIGWKFIVPDLDVPSIFIDPLTNLITVNSKIPPFTWINSDPPVCVNRETESGPPGGCIQ